MLSVAAHDDPVITLAIIVTDEKRTSGSNLSQGTCMYVCTCTIHRRDRKDHFFKHHTYDRSGVRMV